MKNYALILRLNQLPSVYGVSAKIALISTVFGTLVFFGYMLSASEIVLGIGIFGVLVMFIINAIALLACFCFVLTSSCDARDTLFTFYTLLWNIPLALAYFLIVLSYEL